MKREIYKTPKHKKICAIIFALGTFIFLLGMYFLAHFDALPLAFIFIGAGICIASVCVERYKDNQLRRAGQFVPFV